jgi:translation initiation factor 6
MRSENSLLGIYKYDFYRSPNIGLFARSNDNTLLLPFGFAETKANKLKNYLDIKEVVNVSIAGTRLIGPMTVLNNNGILLPSTASDEEVQVFKDRGLNVEQVKSKFTAIGNLISTNDNGAIVSNLFGGEIDQQIKDILGVPVQSMSIGGSTQIGSMIVSTNSGAVVHPKANDGELSMISEILKVEIEPATINAGMPYPSSGIIANSNSVIVGGLTTGPELIMLSKAFKM